jgi:hypothetical protein
VELFAEDKIRALCGGASALCSTWMNRMHAIDELEVAFVVHNMGIPNAAREKLNQSPRLKNRRKLNADVFQKLGIKFDLVSE